MNGISGLYDGMDITKVMYGQNAVSIPLWLVAQNGVPKREWSKRNDPVEYYPVALAGISASQKLMYGTERTHVFILGEAIIRPVFVVATDDFQGRGIGGFWTNPPYAEEWLENGEVILETEIGRAAFMQRSLKNEFE